MLYTVATGGELTSSQQAALEYMYSTNLQVKRALNGIVANAKRNDIIDAMRGKGSILAQSFEELSHNTIQTPKGIHDGPFSDSLKTEGASYIDGLEEISAPRAEELAKEYFADYRITGASCSGEAVTNNLTVYNVDISTADGQMLAQISKKGGKVVMFDSYKDCASKNFSVERCITIAQDFLATLGYEQLEPVWASENGTTCNLNFAPVQDGVVIYPDLIKVKVCEERGLVTGVEAISYVLNHTNRNLPTATLSQEQASSSINGNIEVKQSRLALIPLEQHEVLTYEFFGTLGENEYYVYVDAQTGEEVEVLTIIGTAQGKAIL
jgi:germination protein YpeB